MNPSYIATNLEELFDQAPPDIQQLIQGDEVNSTTAVLGKIYKLPVNSYVALSNLISFILIGALQPQDVPRAFMEVLNLPQDDALKLAQDLDKSILEKARIKIMGKPTTDMVELTFKEGRSEDDLRKEIMDTTKRESGLVKEQSSVPKDESVGQQPIVQATPQPVASHQQPVAGPAAPVEASVIATTSVAGQGVAAGSRSQLLEQLQVLDTIPNDDEVAERLAKIQEQIAGMGGNKDAPDTSVPLHNYLLGEKAAEAVEADSKPATYSKAPTHYNVDPYRETVEE